MLKHNVGDTVTIKKRLKVDMGSPCSYVVDKMLKWKGENMTIRAIENVFGYDVYKMKEDDGEGVRGDGWDWKDEMLES